MRLTPETRVAELSAGPVQEGYAGIDVRDNGFEVRTFTITRMPQNIRTHVDSNGSPDLETRVPLGRVAQLTAGGRPLYFWPEDDGFIYASRSSDPTTSVKTRVAHGSVIRAACGQSACFFGILGDGGISTAVGAVITDQEGQPLTNKIVLPFFVDILSMPSIAPDPNGFTYLRVDGNHRQPARAVRVDLRGRITFDVPLRTFQPQLFWSRDHYVEIGVLSPSLANFYLTAADLSVNGELGQPHLIRQMETYSSHFVVFGDGQNLHVATIDQAHVSVFLFDDAVTSAGLEYEWDVPALFFLADIAAKGPVTVAVLQDQNSALYIMSITPISAPKLLSYGARPQVPIGVDQLGSHYLVAWQEHDLSSSLHKIRAARISRGGVLLDRVPIEVGESDATYPGFIAALHSDTLVLWSTQGAIVRSNGSVAGRIDMTDEPTSAAAALIATDADWILVRQGGGKIVVNRISQSGLVYPTVTLHDSDGAYFVAAATDGQKILALTTVDAITLSADLTVLKRGPAVRQGGTLRFGSDSYILAASDRLSRIDREGNLISDRSFVAGVSTPLVASIRGGWLACSTKSCSRVLPANPPEITATFAIDSLNAISAEGDDHIGFLFVRPTLDAHSVSDAIYFRELELYEAPRKRAIRQ